jgi:hypothetical protein
MTRPIQRLAGLVALFAAVVTQPLQASGQVFGDQEITVSFSFPDGTTKSTSVTQSEIERLTGQRPGYKLLPWVVVALQKLELAHGTETDAKGIKISTIAGVANGPQGEWVYSANGFPSPYRLNTQTIEGITRVSFSYRARTP